MTQTITRADVELTSATASQQTARQPVLKRRLLLLDIAAAALGWGAALGLAPLLTGSPSPVGGRMAWAIGATVATVVLISVQGLHLARVCSVRAVELQGLGRSVLGTVVALVSAEQLLQTQLPLREVGVAATAAFTLLAIERAGFASWLRRHRTNGRFVRHVLIVGADPDAVEVAAVMREHPELGFRIHGYVGSPGHEREMGAPHLGDVLQTEEVIARTGVGGAVVIPSAVDPDVANPLVRSLLDRGIHVQVSSGLRGIAHRRFRATPIAYEPLFYVEPAVLTPWQMACKRAIDIVGAVLGLVAAAPVLALATVAIRLDSRGPVLFRQQRVGRGGQCFTFVKLRTMVRDAEAQLDHLDDLNQRTAGPLFKAAGDPRVTRVGRVLRAASIDELPQLWHVLRGSMSLVGPRPALPSEVERFDPRLRTRTRVAPGLTGLWQIEARDNPAFGPYRRLDLFYVENWSPLLDLGILATTVTRVIGRAVHLVAAPRNGDGAPPDTIVLD